MQFKEGEYQAYFSHLQKISLLGKLYKRFYASLILLICHIRFGKHVIEVGSGIGNGVLGASPRNVIGLDINPIAIDFCKTKGLKADLIKENGDFPIKENSVDVCVLDNVLEHIEYPKKTLDECYRVLKEHGGLVIVVPGMRGYKSDSDHKIFYNRKKLNELDPRWRIIKMFSVPFIIESNMLSRKVSQYCLIAIYTKI
jgi:SAM-dependent methyltransferase